MSHQNKVSIDLIQDYQTLIGFSSDMIIFFGLSGKRTNINEPACLRAVCGRNSGHKSLCALSVGVFGTRESAGSEGASGYSANGGAGAFLDRLLCGK